MTVVRGLKVLVAGVVFIGALATSKPADALAITLSDGSSTISVGDNDFGDINPLSGIITVTGAFGAFDINVITGLSSPVLGSSTQPTMDLSQVSVNYYGGSGSLTVSLSDNNFSLSQLGASVLTSQIGGTYLNSSVTASTSLDFGNALYGSADVVASNGTYGGLLGSFSNDATSGFNYTGGTFSLTQTVNLTLGSPGTASFDLQSTVSSVPEPASVMLLGLGLTGLAAFSRRKLS